MKLKDLKTKIDILITRGHENDEVVITTFNRSKDGKTSCVSIDAVQEGFEQNEGKCFVIPAATIKSTRVK